jgi:hypothetical protein
MHNTQNKCKQTTQHRMNDEQHGSNQKRHGPNQKQHGPNQIQHGPNQIQHGPNQKPGVNQDYCFLQDTHRVPHIAKSGKNIVAARGKKHLHK